MSELLDKINQIDKNNQPIKKSLLGNLNPSKNLLNITTPAIEFAGGLGLGEDSYSSNIPIEALDNLSEIQAQRQSVPAKLGAGLWNTGVQMLGDLGKGASYLADWQQIGGLISGTEQEFGNWFSDLMDKGEEAAKLPVYRTQASIGFHPESAGWWADQLPSIGSTLSILIPAVGTVGLVGKGLEKLGALGKFAELGGTVKGLNTIKGISSALVSRYLENTMEGKQTFDSTYQDLIKKGYADPEARKIAGEAARENWRQNSYNLAFDIPQYMLAFKFFGGAKKFWDKTAGTVLAESGLESVEEMNQFISDKEAQRNAYLKNGVIPDDKSSYVDRLGKYVSDPDFANAAFGGFLGGALFGGYAKFQQKRNQKAVEKGAENFSKDLLSKYGSVLKNNQGEYDSTDDHQFLEILHAAAAGNAINHFEQALEKMQEDAINLPEDERAQAQKNLTKRLQDLKTYKANLEKVGNELIPNELKPIKAYTLTAKSMLGQRIQENDARLTKLTLDDVIEGNISHSLAELRNEYLTTQARKHYGISTKEEETALKAKIKDVLDSDIHFDINSLEDLNKVWETSAVDKVTQEIYNREKNNADLNQVNDLVKKVSTKTGQEELLKEQKKAQEEYVKEQAKEALRVEKEKADKLKDDEKRAQDAAKQGQQETTTEDQEEPKSKPIKGVIQLQKDLSKDPTITSIPFVDSKVNDSGFTEYTLPDGSVLSQEEGYDQPNITPDRGPREILSGPDHFNRIQKYHNTREAALAALVSKKTRLSIPEVLQKYPKAFRALNFRTKLSEILSKPDYQDHINLVIGKVQTSKEDVVRENNGIRLISNPKYHVLLEISYKDEAGKDVTETFFHPYSTEFYEIQDEKGEYVPLSPNISKDKFYKHFTFESSGETQQEYEEFIQSLKAAQEFRRDLSLWYEKQGTDKFVKVPKGAFNIVPYEQAFNWLEKGEQVPLAGSKLDKFPVIYATLHKFTSITGEELPRMPDLPASNLDGYYIAVPYPNGVNRWVRVAPATKVLTDHTALVKQLQDTLAELDSIKFLKLQPEERKIRIKELLSDLNLYITPTDLKYQVSIYIDLDDHGRYRLQFKVLRDKAKESKKNFYLYTLKDFDTFIKFIESFSTKQGENLMLGPKNLKSNPGKLKKGDPRIRESLFLTTQENPVAVWGMVLGYNSWVLLQDSPQPVPTPADVIGEQEISGDELEQELASTPSKEARIEALMAEKGLTRADATIAIETQDAVTTLGGKLSNTDDWANEVHPTGEITTPFTIQEAISDAEKTLPKEISVRLLEDIIHSLEVNGIPVGHYRESALYVREIGNSGDYYHEKFHAIFRNLLSDDKTRIYLNKKKTELGYSPERLQAEKDRLLAEDPRNKVLSEQELEDLVYEEQIAEDYAKYQVNKDSEKRTIWKDLYDLIMRVIDYFRTSDIDALFRKIQRGQFKQSSILSTKYNGKRTQDFANKIISNLDQSTSDTIIRQILGGYFSAPGLSLINLYNSVKDSYDISLKANQDFLSELHPNDQQSARTKMLQIWATLDMPSTQNLILEQVMIKARYSDVEINPEDEEVLEEQGQRVFDVPAFEINPADGPGKYVKDFIVSTLFTGYDEVGREVKMALDWKDVYNSLLPAFNETVCPQNKIMDKMRKLSKSRPRVKALYDRLVRDTGYSKEAPEGTKNKNILIRWKKGFQLVQTLYTSPKITIGEGEISTEVYHSNKLDIAKHQFEAFRNQHFIAFNRYRSGDINTIKDDIERVITKISDPSRQFPDWRFNGIKEPYKIVQQIFNNTQKLKAGERRHPSLGIEVEPEYIKDSFTETEEIKGDSFEPITIEDLSFIRQHLSTNNLFEASETGQAGLMKRIAVQNQQYTDQVITNNYITPDGKPRYSWTVPSTATKRHSLLQDKTIAELNKDKKDPYLSLNNITANKNAFHIIQNSELSYVGELSVDDRGEAKGVTMKTSDPLTVLLTQHLLYSKRTVKNDINTAIYWLSQIESKRTQVAAALPASSFYKDGNLTPEAETALFNMFLQENRRTKGVYKKNFKSLKNKDKYILFNFFNQADEKVQEYLDKPEKYKDEIIDLIYLEIQNEISEHKNLLVKNSLIQYLNQDRIKTDGGINNYIGNFILNHFIWANAYLQLVNGDIGWASSFADYIKRLSGYIAAGTDYGDGNKRSVFIPDEIFYRSPDTKTRISKAAYEAKPENYPGYKKVTSTDGQVYSHAGAYKKDQYALGLLSDEQEKVIDQIINPIIDGKFTPVTPEQLKLSGVDMVSAKKTTRGLDQEGNEVYFKDSVVYLTRELTSSWVNGQWIPLTGMEDLHDKLEYMEKHDIDELVPESAAKLYYPEESRVLTDYTKELPNSVHIIPNYYTRLQVENSTKYNDRIPLGPQAIHVLGSEITSEEGKELKKDFERDLSTQKTQLFEFYQKLVAKYTDGILSRGQVSVILDRFRRITEETSPDSQLSQFLETSEGKLLYDSNLLHILPKLEQLYLSMYQDAFKVKVHGRALTAVSSHGFNIVENSEGKIITPEEQRSIPGITKNAIVRPLAPNEILIPRKHPALAGLKIGDKISKEIFAMFGYRIPLQSYNFIHDFTIAGFLPDIYGDICVVSDIHNLRMGMDHDLDKLFVMFKGWYQTDDGLKVYGTETTNQERFDAFKIDTLKSNSFVKDEYNKRILNNENLTKAKKRLTERLETLKEARESTKFIRKMRKISDTHNNIIKFFVNLDERSFVSEDLDDFLLSQMFTKNALDKVTQDLINSIKLQRDLTLTDVLKNLNLPSTSEEFAKSGMQVLSAVNNRMLGTMKKILALPELQEALYSALSTDKTEEAVTTITKAVPRKIHPFGNSINSIHQSTKDNMASVNLRGRAVKAGETNQVLSENNITVNEEYPVYYGDTSDLRSVFRTDDLRTKADTHSTLVGSIIDSVKNPVGDILNWSKITIPVYGIGVGLGIPELDMALFIAQPSIVEITDSQDKLRILSARNFDDAVSTTIDKYKDTLKRYAEQLKTSTLWEEQKAEISKALAKNIEPIISKNLINTLVAPKPTDLKASIYFTISQLQTLKAFKNLNTIVKSAFQLSTISGLNRDVSTNFVNSRKYKEAYDHLLDPDESALNGVKEYFDTNVLTQTNIKNSRQLLETSKVLFISQTKFFDDLYSEMRNIVKPGKHLPEMKRNMISAMQMSLFFKMTGVAPLSLLDLVIGDNSLAHRIKEAKKDPVYENNILIKYILNPSFANKEQVLNFVKADSRVKISQRLHDILLDNFTEIRIQDLDKKGINKLSNQLFAYLVIKDNLQFTSNSFIKYIDPANFQPLSKRLEALNNLLANDDFDPKQFKELVGKTPQEFKDNFIENYSRSSKNKKYIKTLDTQPDKLSVVMRVQGADSTNQVLAVEGKDGKLIYTVIAKAEKVLAKFKRFKITVEDGKIKADFPKFVNIWGYNEMTNQSYSNVYKLEESTGTKGVYGKVTRFFVKDMSNYALTPIQNEELNERVKALLPKKDSGPSIEQYTSQEDYTGNEEDSEDAPWYDEQGNQMEDTPQGIIPEGIKEPLVKPGDREYTPKDISSLKPNEIFVFGSNQGSSKGGPPTHGRGAALLARQKFGAIQGQTEGLQGQSYAVVTKKFYDVPKSSSLPEIQTGLAKMLAFATKTPDKKFLVTKLGSDLAGYKVHEIKQLFENLKNQIPDNVVLPKEYEVRDTQTPEITTSEAETQWTEHGEALTKKYGAGIKDIWNSKDSEWREHKITCL